jgi:hypothetical protein
MTGGRCSRRGFLVGLGAVASWAIAGTTAQSGHVTTRRLLAMFRQTDSAAAIGLRLAPRHSSAPAGAAMLARRVAEELAFPAGDIDRLSDAELRTAVDRLVRNDFAQGRIVRVDGWILSLTEARLCALAALAREV